MLGFGFRVFRVQGAGFWGVEPESSNLNPESPIPLN